MGTRKPSSGRHGGQIGTKVITEKTNKRMYKIDSIKRQQSVQYQLQLFPILTNDIWTNVLLKHNIKIVFSSKNKTKNLLGTTMSMWVNGVN